ncbi:MAG: hypothetical protein GY927_10370 [bacterium]|nr:hypothetical protein [bacterium]
MLDVITTGVKAAIKELENDAKQTRYAAKRALDNTAFKVAQDVKKAASRQLDRPTPFTLRGIKYRKATKQDLTASVYIDAIQAGYLQWSVFGGTRKGRSSSGEALPVEVALNKHGNITGRHKGKIQKLIARHDTFVERINGIYGLWQRGNVAKSGRFSTGGKRRHGSIRLLVRFVPYVDYDKRFKFHDAAERSFHKHFPKEFDKAFEQAMRTAR